MQKGTEKEDLVWMVDKKEGTGQKVDGMDYTGRCFGRHSWGTRHFSIYFVMFSVFPLDSRDE